MFTSGKARQVAAVPHVCCQPSMRTCLRSRSNAFRARPKRVQHVVACSSSSAAASQQAGSLHPLVPRPTEFMWGWLPAAWLLMLLNFNMLGEFSEQLPLCLEKLQLDPPLTGMLVLVCSSICHICRWRRPVHHFKCRHGCMVLPCIVSLRPASQRRERYRTEWSKCNGSCTCFCWHRGGPLRLQSVAHPLSHTSKSSGELQTSSCLNWCSASLHVRNVSPMAIAGPLCIGADMRPAGCRASLQQQPVPAGQLWQLHCGFGRAYVSGQVPGSSSPGSM